MIAQEPYFDKHEFDYPDTVQRFTFEQANIRGEIAHLHTPFTTIINQRSYPPMVKQLLGEVLVAGLLLTSSIKFAGEISIQFQGDERLPLLLVQCNNQLQLRGFAKFKENRADNEYAEAFINGKMVITMTQDNQTHAYQSMVPVQSTSMSENLMHYFTQSEQITTHIWLAVGTDRAAGMLLQLMPGQNTTQREQFWQYAVQLGQTVSEQELLHLDNQTLLHRLYHEMELRLYPCRSASFQCRCNGEKMRQVLTVLGEHEANQLLSEQGKIDIACEFCSSHYFFDSVDVALLFHKNSLR